MVTSTFHTYMYSLGALLSPLGIGAALVEVGGKTYRIPVLSSGLHSLKLFRNSGKGKTFRLTLPFSLAATFASISRVLNRIGMRGLII